MKVQDVEVAQKVWVKNIAALYPSDKDYKWVIHSNHIRNYPVKVQDVEVAQKVWVKNIAALKGNITQKKQNLVAMDQVDIPVGLIKFHKVVFLTCDIFFMNEIPFLLTLSHSSQSSSKSHSAINIQSLQ